jgi:hypothetical protein
MRELTGLTDPAGYDNPSGGVDAVELPADTAPPGRRPPPLRRSGAARIGLDASAAGPMRSVERLPLPEPDPLALELAGAKEYIASLQARVDELEAPGPNAASAIASLARQLRRKVSRR